MRLRILIAACLTLGSNPGSCQSGNINGKWIVTECVSDDPGDSRISDEEIKRNLGGWLTMSKEVLIDHLNGNPRPDTCRQLQVILKNEDAETYFRHSKKIATRARYDGKKITLQKLIVAIS